MRIIPIIKIFDNTNYMSIPMAVALKQQRQHLDMSAHTALSGGESDFDLDPDFAKALHYMFAAYDRGLQPKLEVRGNPFDAIMQLREKLRYVAADYHMDDRSVNAMDEEVTHSTAEAAKGKGLNDVKVMLTVTDKPLPVDQSLYNFMRTWDRNGQRNGAGYGSRIMKLTASGTKTSEMPDQDQLYMGGQPQVVLHIQGIQADGVDGLDEVAAALTELAVAAGPGVGSADLQDIQNAITQGKATPIQQQLVQNVAALNHVAHVVSRAPETVANAPQEIQQASKAVNKAIQTITEAKQVPAVALLNATISSLQRSEVVAAASQKPAIAPMHVKPQLTTIDNASAPVLKADNTNIIGMVKPSAPALENVVATEPSAAVPSVAAPEMSVIAAEPSALMQNSVPLTIETTTPKAAVSATDAPAVIESSVSDMTVSASAAPSTQAPISAEISQVEAVAAETPITESPSLSAMEGPQVAVLQIQTPPQITVVENNSPSTFEVAVVEPANIDADNVSFDSGQIEIPTGDMPPVSTTEQIVSSSHVIEKQTSEITTNEPAIEATADYSVAETNFSSHENGLSTGESALVADRPKSTGSFIADAPVTSAIETSASEFHSGNTPELTVAQTVHQEQTVQMKAAQDTITSVAASLGVSANALNITAAEIVNAPKMSKQTLQNMAQKPVQQMMESQIILDREEREADKRKEHDKSLRQQEREADEKKAKDKRDQEALARAYASQQPMMQTMQIADTTRPKAASEQAQADYEKFFKKSEIKVGGESLSSNFNKVCNGRCDTCPGCVVGQSSGPAPTV